MKNYTRISGKIAADRCTKKYMLFGEPMSALYCDCGCQTPHDDDPDINLDGVTVVADAVSEQGNHMRPDEGCRLLARNGIYCGQISLYTHDWLWLDGVEYMGITDGCTQRLVDEAIALGDHDAKTDIGDTLVETAAAERRAEEIDLMEQDARNADHPGYCTKCHSYCWGDCDAVR